MEVALVTFVGAGLTSIASGFGIAVPERAMLGGFQLVRFLFGADNPRISTLVTQTVGDIWQDWQASGLPADVAARHIVSLPAIMDVHRPAADLQIGAIAAAKSAVRLRSGPVDVQARRLASEIVGMARASGHLDELGLSAPVAFFFLERLYARLLGELELIESLISSFDIYFYKGLWQAEAEGIETAGRSSAEQLMAVAAESDATGSQIAEMRQATVAEETETAASDNVVHEAAAHATDNDSGNVAALPVAIEPIDHCAPAEIALDADTRALCVRLTETIAAIAGGTAEARALRATAAELVTLGQIGAADRYLSDAEDQDLKAAQIDISNVRSHLSAAAETRAARGAIEEIKGDYRRAARHYIAAVRCLPSNDSLGRWRFGVAQALALTKQSEMHGDASALSEAAQIYADACRQLPPGDAPNEWASTQLTLANLLLVLGERESRIERFDDAARHARAASDAYDSIQEMSDWGRAQLVFGHALRQRGDAVRSVADLEDAQFAYRAALGVFARDRMPEEWVSASSSLGLVLIRLGELGSGPEAFEESLQHLNAALAVAERTNAPADIARLQMARGNALLALFALTDVEPLAGQATAAFRAALNVCDGDKHPREAVSMRHRLAMALWAEGARSGSQEKLGEAARQLIDVLDQAQNLGDDARVYEVHSDLQTLHNDLAAELARGRQAELKIA